MVSKRIPNFLIYSSSLDWLFLGTSEHVTDIQVVPQELDLQAKLASLKSFIQDSANPHSEVCLLVDSADCFVVDANDKAKQSTNQVYYELEEVLPIDAEEMELANLVIRSDVDIVINKREIQLVKQQLVDSGLKIRLVAPLATFQIQASGFKPQNENKVAKALSGTDVFQFSNRRLVAWTWHPTEQDEKTSELESLGKNLQSIQTQSCFSKPWVSFSANATGTSNLDYRIRTSITIVGTIFVLIAIVNLALWNRGTQFYSQGRHLFEVQKQIARAVDPDSRPRVDVEGFLDRELEKRKSDQAVGLWLEGMSDLQELVRVLDIVSKAETCRLTHFGIQSKWVYVSGSIEAANQKALVGSLTESGYEVFNQPSSDKREAGDRQLFSWRLSKEGNP